MGYDFWMLEGQARQFAERLVIYAQNPWFAYQAIIVVLLFGVSKFIGARIEPALEARARLIKGQPSLLRVVIALMRRVDWILFVVFLFLAETIIRAATWPSRSYLVSVVLSLSFAWLLVAVASRVIRSRALARTIAWMAWLYAAVLILGIESQTGALLDSVAVSVGQYRISVLMVGKAIVLLTVLIWLASTIGNFVDDRVQRSQELTPSIRVLIGKVLKFGLVIIAGAIALSAVGVNLTALTVFSGAIGVGLGFGLQKVVSNFISGIIILADKSIKPGDTITLGDTFGWIRELRARFVSVVTRDGREFLIPNEDFITQRVVNWSFSDDFVRLDVHFGVAYDSDPHAVTELAIGAASTVARVVVDRRPVCWITGFGESSIDFVLRFWISDPQQGLTNIRGRVLLALWDTFKENGIRIPYPHRQIIMDAPVDFRNAAMEEAPQKPARARKPNGNPAKSP